jgi:hypothetical protein
LKFWHIINGLAMVFSHKMFSLKLSYDLGYGDFVNLSLLLHFERGVFTQTGFCVIAFIIAELKQIIQ